MKTYIYRQGDGNEGNYPQFYVTLQDDDNPWIAVRALMVNRYIPNTKTRSHVMRESSAEGEEAFGITGTVHEGPKGEEAFGAAWLTAELQPATQDEADRSSLQHYASLQDALDTYAFRFYCRELVKECRK